uniref:BolA-like protein n=1 Tax=Candidozyma auris TaxID=498019 RepID=A0A0L0P0P3_CANAR
MLTTYAMTKGFFRKIFITRGYKNTIFRIMEKDGHQGGPVERLIFIKLSTLLPQQLIIKNDSHKHTHHAAMKNAANLKESHFRVQIISDHFKGKSLPARHRLVYSLLEDEFKSQGLHALQMTTRTPEEEERRVSKKSP